MDETANEKNENASNLENTSKIDFNDDKISSDSSNFSSNGTPLFHDYDNYEYYAIDLVLKDFKEINNQNTANSNIIDNSDCKSIDNPIYYDKSLNFLSEQSDSTLCHSKNIQNIPDEPKTNNLRVTSRIESTEQSFILYDESKI